MEDVKHTFVDKNGKQVTKTIPGDYIARNMVPLGLTLEETCQMYTDEKGWTINQEWEEMKTQGTGGMRVTGNVTNKPRKVPERKPNMTKRALIAALAEFLEANEMAVNVKTTNIERMIAFEADNNKYELTLTQKRPPKD